MKVVCVLRTGVEFAPQHVLRLGDQFAAHAPSEADFVCLTDHEELLGADFARPLEHGWPGWWSKLEAYALSGPCIYMDLDVNVVGDLSPLFEAVMQHEFIMCGGFWGAEDPNPWNSSVVGWSGDASILPEVFARSPAAFMSAYKLRDRWGDQAFVRDHWPGTVETWQSLLPGKVMSFKRDVQRGVDRRQAAIVVSHGKPRPWALDGADAWLKQRTRVK